LENEEKVESSETCKIDMLLAVERREFDFTPEREFPGRRPVGLKEWLEEAWRGVDFEDT